MFVSTFRSKILTGLSLIFLCLWVSSSVNAGGGNAENCTIPPSGPWPPCAIGGNTPSTPSNNNDCVIPPSGPWPPCARGDNNTPTTTTPPSNNNNCTIPPSGPWPPCATNGNNWNGPTNTNNNSNDNECVIPPSGPWPPCARETTPPLTHSPPPSEPLRVNFVRQEQLLMPDDVVNKTRVTYSWSSNAQHVVVSKDVERSRLPVFVAMFEGGTSRFTAEVGHYQFTFSGGTHDNPENKAVWLLPQCRLEAWFFANPPSECPTMGGDSAEFTFQKYTNGFTIRGLSSRQFAANGQWEHSSVAISRINIGTTVGDPIRYTGREQCQRDSHGYGECYIEGPNKELYYAGGNQIGGGHWRQVPVSDPVQSTNWYAQYYNNTTQTGIPAHIDRMADLEQNWGQRSPAWTVQSDNFSATFSRYLLVTKPIEYDFTLSADDLATLFIDGKPIFSSTPNRQTTVKQILVPGRYLVVVNYHEGTGDAQIAFNIHQHRIVVP